MEAKSDRDTKDQEQGRHGRPREGEVGSGATRKDPRELKKKGKEKAGEQSSSFSL